MSWSSQSGLDVLYFYRGFCDMILRLYAAVVFSLGKIFPSYISRENHVISPKITWLYLCPVYISSHVPKYLGLFFKWDFFENVSNILVGSTYELEHNHIYDFWDMLDPISWTPPALHLTNIIAPWPPHQIMPQPSINQTFW